AISLFTRMPRSGGPGEACFGCAVGFPRAGTHGHRFAEPEAAASEPRNYSGAAAPRFRAAGSAAAVAPTGATVAGAEDAGKAPLRGRHGLGHLPSAEKSSPARPKTMVITRDIEYAADGSTMVGRLALPEGEDKRAAVLIAHEGGGLDDYQKSRAERFAELGHVAFALDYYGGGKPLTDRDEIAARCEAL